MSKFQEYLEADGEFRKSTEMLKAIVHLRDLYDMNDSEFKKFDATGKSKQSHMREALKEIKKLIK